MYKINIKSEISDEEMVALKNANADITEICWIAAGFDIFEDGEIFIYHTPILIWLN